MVVWTTPNYDWRYLIVRLSTPKRPATLHKLSAFPFPNQPIFQNGKELCSGGRTRTGDLQVMSLASYQLLLPRNSYQIYKINITYPNFFGPVNPPTYTYSGLFAYNGQDMMVLHPSDHLRLPAS